MALLWAGWCAGPSTIGSHLRGCDIKINECTRSMLSGSIYK